ncbi:poly(ADP-ribose) glycohydrolase domain-containing protein [Streptomyces scopuliridis]|uniref:poly(ADP-ribose) glycohydrolase domain-containing protein n=1 Tax=Streptomyces scopuliridis TaxID=452529 RepID=UPI000D1375CA
MSAPLRGIAKETEEIVRTGGYRTETGRDVGIRTALDAAVAGTRMYGPAPVAVPPATKGRRDPRRTGRRALLRTGAAGAPAARVTASRTAP